MPKVRTSLLIDKHRNQDTDISEWNVSTVPFCQGYHLLLVLARIRSFNLGRNRLVTFWYVHPSIIIISINRD